ncbi:PDR/VanB family oxidoreductase [Methylobacterium sp. C1]|uniref:PDR/VanB family oxidoreductase n=1 Tax=Methylobacterium sp. C1 TaxID=1479019 RepID=UPI0008DAF974|nr:PDR/VanB family oxidoreductase [Methylobacterium sp. C1]
MADTKSNRILLQVQRTRDLSAWVREYELFSLDGSILIPYEAGAHIDLHVPGIGNRQYSLVQMSRPGAPYVVAVQREDTGRGGSTWIHANLEVGGVVEAGGPRNHFPLLDAPHTLLIAGGIGLTPLMCMAETCEALGRSWHLVVCGRDEGRLIFVEELLGPKNHGQARFVLDGGDPTKGLDIAALLAGQPAGTRVYCCGPDGLMGAVREAGKDLAGIEMHFESFGAAAAPLADDADCGPFSVECVRSGVTVEVPDWKSVLDALLEAGIDVDHSCREGYCGTCLTRWSSGDPVHRDTCMTDAERARYVAVCTSRARTGSNLVLDL